MLIQCYTCHQLSSKAVDPLETAMKQQARLQELKCSIKCSRAQMFYLDTANPANYTGNVTSWGVCYYGPDSIGLLDDIGCLSENGV